MSDMGKEEVGSIEDFEEMRRVEDWMDLMDALSDAIAFLEKMDRTVKRRSFLDFREDMLGGVFEMFDVEPRYIHLLDTEIEIAFPVKVGGRDTYARVDKEGWHFVTDEEEIRKLDRMFMEVFHDASPLFEVGEGPVRGLKITVNRTKGGGE